MSIVITGASGHLGRLTAELVLDRMPASEVILTTRHPEALSDLAERGATVRKADFDRPETLVEAFAGGEKLLLISADDLGRRAAQHRAAIEAARVAGVRHVAYTSYLNPVEDNPAAITLSHRDTEWALRESGLIGVRCATPSTPSIRFLPARRRSPRASSSITAGRGESPTSRARTAPRQLPRS